MKKKKNTLMGKSDILRFYEYNLRSIAFNHRPFGKKDSAQLFYEGSAYACGFILGYDSERIDRDTEDAIKQYKPGMELTFPDYERDAR